MLIILQDARLFTLLTPCFQPDNSRSVTAFNHEKGLLTSQCRNVLMNNLLLVLFNYVWQLSLPASRLNELKWLTTKKRNEKGN